MNSYLSAQNPIGILARLLAVTQMLYIVLVIVPNVLPMQEVLGGVVGAYPVRQSHEKLPGVLVQVVEFRSQLCAVRLMEESHSFMSVNYRTQLKLLTMDLSGTSYTLHKITSKRGQPLYKEQKAGFQVCLICAPLY